MDFIKTVSIIMSMLISDFYLISQFYACTREEKPLRFLDKQRKHVFNNSLFKAILVLLKKEVTPIHLTSLVNSSLIAPLNFP